MCVCFQGELCCVVVKAQFPSRCSRCDTSMGRTLYSIHTPFALLFLYVVALAVHRPY